MGQTTIMGNWKMYKSLPEVESFFEAFTRDFVKENAVAVKLMLPDIYLAQTIKQVEGFDFSIGAQDAFYQKEGAYTGEVSAEQLASIGVGDVLIGHSERRQYFGDDDEIVNKKVLAALAAGMRPTICIGETLAQRQAKQTHAVIKQQIETALDQVPADVIGQLTFGYEPIWAIGSGETAEASDANAVAATIRTVIADLAGEAAGQRITILYGGSVKPDNLADFMTEDNIDGALIGGASLDVNSFLDMIKVAEDYA